MKPILWLALSVLVGSLHLRFSLLKRRSVLTTMYPSYEAANGKWLGFTFSNFVVCVVTLLIVSLLLHKNPSAFGSDLPSCLIALGCALVWNGWRAIDSAISDMKKDQWRNRLDPDNAIPYGLGSGLAGMAIGVLFILLAPLSS